MTKTGDRAPFAREACLTGEDIYCYIAKRGGEQRLSIVEAHLAVCSDCRQELAELLELLQPSQQKAMELIPEPSETELNRSIALVQEVARKEHDRVTHLRVQWPVAAAAAIGIIALSLWGFKYLYERNRSELFYSQAKVIVERDYAGTSPSNLRLVLPFSPSASSRQAAPYHDSLRPAENLFYQALAIREDMVEAHLGLGYVYLNESKFELARNEFQKILKSRSGSEQALVGRGVSQYEQALQAEDPALREALLAGALRDFNGALQIQPKRAEARYNKAWTLFESGLHKEALQEIEQYLSVDPESIWSERLKLLRTKIQATSSRAVEENVNRAARTRDRGLLEGLAEQAPYQVPAAIRSALRRSLEMEGAPTVPESPTSEDLRWAAEVMETAYSRASRDNSFRALLRFYAGLSPPQRALKKALDAKLQTLVNLYRSGDLNSALSASKPLELQYDTLQDYWQICTIHHLRGNCFYYGKADFRAANGEYRKLLAIAEQLDSPDATAKALASLAAIYGQQGKFDDSLRCANRLKALAEEHNLDSWKAEACLTLANQFRRLGQFELSLREYTLALGLSSRLLNKNDILEILENLGVVTDRLGRLQEARDFYRRALQQQDSMQNGTWERPEALNRRLNLLFKQGDLALRSGDLTAAEALFQECVKSAPNGMREFEARNRIGLAEVYTRQGRTREAGPMLARALALSSSGQYADVEWRARVVQGRLLEAGSDYAGAFSSFQQAIASLERMRRNIKPTDLREVFLTDRFDPYREIVSLLCRSRDDERAALDFVDRAKSMTLKEQLKQQDTDLGLRGDSAGVAQKEGSLPMVEYFFTNDSLLIFATLQGQVHAYAKSISSGDISSQVAQYLESINKNDAASFQRLARTLYDELIAPVEQYVLAGRPETLVVLPDGPLHLLPFAGLEDERGRFLIEKTPVVLAPSRSVFRHCLWRRQNRPLSDGHEVLLLDGSESLPSAREELEYISRLYGRSTVLLAPKDVRELKKAAIGSEILHFAGHAVSVEGKPALMMRKFPHEVYLDSEEISTWKLPRTDLVNLAGCSTGIGPQAEGEAPWGLIPAFLNAGATTIIASLMPVDDLSTKRLTCRFYELLQQGISKAAALQQAQLELLDSARSSQELKPQSWIPYILVGNPR